MSATLDTQLFCSYFADAPALCVPGRTFPVRALYLEDALQLTKHCVRPNAEWARRVGIGIGGKGFGAKGRGGDGFGARGAGARGGGGRGRGGMGLDEMDAFDEFGDPVGLDDTGAAVPDPDDDDRDDEELSFEELRRRCARLCRGESPHDPSPSH
eukprot:5803655-Pleurochrysis_carterae.AAC.1